MAPKNHNTYTVGSINWNEISSISTAAAEFAEFSRSTSKTANEFMELYESMKSYESQDRQKDRERKQRAVKAMRPFMDLLTDPRVMFLRRWVDVERSLYVDGNTKGPGEYMDVDPNWLVTIGVAVNIKSREVEFWASSPTSTLCWLIDTVLHGGIDHLTTTATTSIWGTPSLEAKWIEVLADLAESSESRFTNDPKPPTEPEKEAVKSIADLLREAPVADRWDWVKPEDWQRQPQPPPFAPGSPPGTYTLSSGDNYFATILDSVTSAPEPEPLTIEKLMNLSKQLKDAKENRKYFSIMDVNTTA